MCNMPRDPTADKRNLMDGWMDGCVICMLITSVDSLFPQAQQLPAPITSASKLQSQKHQLYMLKDGERNGYILSSALTPFTHTNTICLWTD